ncbi:hypothetical protein HMPREF9554_00397 [Treponema phagedenis F0421]|nr:hypothetical protein HMPREF9554_00397 [Treponema phagedenis F0421]
MPPATCRKDFFVIANSFFYKNTILLIEPQQSKRKTQQEQDFLIIRTVNNCIKNEPDTAQGRSFENLL